MSIVCDACEGKGSFVPNSSKCAPCGGQGKVRERKTIKVDIPAGVNHGTRIRLSGKGDYPTVGKGQPGDLFIEITVGEHKIFRREGFDIHVKAYVPLHIALLGGYVKVPTVDGSVELKVKPGIQPGDKQVMRNKGVKKLKSAEYGDQYVTLQVEIPKSLTERQKELLTKAFVEDTEESSSSKRSSKFNEEEDSSFLKGLFSKKSKK
ncbi:hypothetical protein HK099_001995, partial [Clydaea vesicula]